MNLGLFLKLNYPVGSRFLCLTEGLENNPENINNISDIQTVLSYPNSQYRLVNKYVHNTIVICELDYIGEIDNQNLIIDFPNFDNQFLFVLKYLDNEQLNKDWIYLYIYLLEDLRRIDQIIKKSKLKVREIFNKYEENYLEKFREFIKDKSIRLTEKRDKYEYVDSYRLTLSRNLGHKINEYEYVQKLNEEEMLKRYEYIFKVDE